MNKIIIIIFSILLSNTVVSQDSKKQIERNRFIERKDNVYGVIDSLNKIIIPFSYDLIRFKYNKFIVRSNGLNGIYDINGKILIPEKYQFYTIDNNKIFATNNNQPVILDIQNSIKTQKLENDIIFINTVRHYSFGESLYQIIKKENRYGVINSENEVVIPAIYDEIKSSQNWRYFIITQNNKVGLIHVDGKITKSPIYDDIELRKEYVILKRKNEKDEFYSYEY